MKSRPEADFSERYGAPSKITEVTVQLCSVGLLYACKLNGKLLV